MVGALAAYAFSSSGALAWTFPDLLNNDRLRINYLLLAVSAAAAVAFARSFFEERIFTPWLARARSEEHTSELQSLMRNSYAVSCLKKKNTNPNHIKNKHTTTTN